jgi:hypothetical protein
MGYLQAYLLNVCLFELDREKFNVCLVCFGPMRITCTVKPPASLTKNLLVSEVRFSIFFSNSFGFLNISSHTSFAVTSYNKAVDETHVFYSLCRHSSF